MFNFYFLLFLLGSGYFVGQYFEKKHFRNLDEREKKLRHIPVITGEWRNQITSEDEGVAMSSGTVVASDYFKSFVSSLKNIFGGRMNAYESLIDRGRRESILRLKEKASTWGGYKIINLRVETSTINAASQKKGSLPCIELFAYGTVIRKKNNG